MRSVHFQNISFPYNAFDIKMQKSWSKMEFVELVKY